MLTGQREARDISPLPTHDALRTTHGAQRTAHGAQRTAHSALPTVLVVDDESLIRTSWKVRKKSLNIGELFEYPNLEALQAAKLDLSKIDLAFVDKNIEDSKFSGSDVVKYLREQQIKKIIVASGEDEEAIRQDPELARADHIISDKIPESLDEFLKPLNSESAVILSKENSTSLQNSSKTWFKQNQSEFIKNIEKNRTAIDAGRQLYSHVPELSQAFDYYAKQFLNIENSFFQISKLAESHAKLNDQLAVFKNMKDQNETLAHRVFEKIS